MRKTAKAADFLSKLPGIEPEEPSQAPPVRSNVSQAAPTRSVRNEPIPKAKIGRPAKRAGGRSGLKHLGGYVEDNTAERFALLKIRLKQNNDELLKTMVDALYREQKVKKKWDE